MRRIVWIDDEDIVSFGYNENISIPINPVVNKINFLNILLNVMLIEMLFIAIKYLNLFGFLYK